MPQLWSISIKAKNRTGRCRCKRFKPSVLSSFPSHSSLTFQQVVYVDPFYVDPMIHLYSSWKRQTTFFGFLTLSGGTEIKHWAKMGLTKKCKHIKKDYYFKKSKNTQIKNKPLAVSSWRYRDIASQELLGLCETFWKTKKHHHR